MIRLKTFNMIVYNVTVSLDPSVEKDWLEWMKSKHIKDVINTKCFTKARLSKVQGREDGECTYAITYDCHSAEILQNYIDNHAKTLQQEHTQKYNGKFAAFRTLMDVIEEF